MNCKNPDEVRIRTVSVKVTDDEFAALDKYCSARNITKSTLVRELILKEIKQNEQNIWKRIKNN